MKKEQKITAVLFGIYMVILTWIILFKMAASMSELPQLRNINLIPYSESVIVNGKLDFDELIQNAIAFVPVGIYLSMLKPKWSFIKKILPIAGISLLYEILQYILAIGATDITDLLNNTIGGIVGIGFYFFAKMLLKDKTVKVMNILAVIGTVGVLGLMGLLLAMN